MFPNETSIKLTYTAGAGRFSSRPQPVRVGGPRFARPAHLSDSTQCSATRTSSLSPASTVADSARVSAAIMSRQASTSAT